MEALTTTSSEVQSSTTFKDIIRSPQLNEALVKLGFTQPTPVQRAAVPVAITGKDLLVQAKTGSGKTLAFALPLLVQIEQLVEQRGTVGLIVTPTRELATQITQVISSLSPIKPACLIGGVSMGAQSRELEEDNRIIVGTPGRINDFIQQRAIILRKCKFFVLDEADEMLSPDFIEDVRAILSRLPEQRQGLFISATLTPRVEMLAKSFLKDPERIIVDTPAETPSTIEHQYYEVGGELTAKSAALADAFETIRPRSAIIFCNTKSDTELVEVFLRRRGFNARRINSDLGQKQRDYIMNKIRAGELQILVGTDIAARGIDIEQLDLVVNYAIPDQPEVYTHRTGRTGRAGRSGRALSIIGPQEFASFQALKRAGVADLQKLPLPSEDEVAKARVTHFLELLKTESAAAHPRDVNIAKALLEQLAGLKEVSEELVTFLARLYRFSVEHIVKPETMSLEDEMRGLADRDSDGGARDSGREGGRGRSSRAGSGRRDSHHRSYRGGHRGGRDQRGYRR